MPATRLHSFGHLHEGKHECVPVTGSSVNANGDIDDRADNEMVTSWLLREEEEEASKLVQLAHWGTNPIELVM